VKADLSVVLPDDEERNELGESIRDGCSGVASMSGQATGWVLRYGPKDRAKRAVLLTIADAANRDGEHAHPGVTAMVEGSLYSRPTVLRHVAEMVEEGWLVIEQQGGGRGRATVYAIPGVKRSQDETVSPPERSHSATETVSSEPETVSQQGPDQPERVHNGLSTVTTNGTTSVAASDDATQGMVEELCKLLADAIAEHGAAKVKPAVTATWRKDMSLLLRRGPAKIATPGPLDPERVARAIAVLFSELNVPQGSSGFCWADQVQSPTALRKHWNSIANAARAQRRAGPGAKRQRLFDDLRREGDADVVDIGSRAR
jgi:hypothetical protein